METKNVDVRELVARMRTSVGMGLTEMARKAGVNREVARCWELGDRPLTDNGRLQLLKYLTVLCQADGCDLPARMRRFREERGLSISQAAKASRMHRPSEWRRLEDGGRSALIRETVRNRVYAFLEAAELDELPQAAE